MSGFFGFGDPTALALGAASISRLYAGASLLWNGGAYPPGPPRVAFIGDSTIAEYPPNQGIIPVGNRIVGISAYTLAVPGHNADQQLAVWSARSDKRQFRAAIIQVGLNDVGSRPAPESIVRIQALVNAVRSGLRSDATLLISKMLPCRGRWEEVERPELTGATLQQRWVDINEAIAGNGPAPITGVGRRITAHVPLLDDGNGYLAPSYNIDGIHENNDGRAIIEAAHRAALVEAGILPE